MLLSYTVHEISMHYPRMARTEVKFPPLRGGGGGGGGGGAVCFRRLRSIWLTFELHWT